MLRRTLLFAVFATAAIGLSERPLSACGDKFLVLGRSVGYDKMLKASKPARVLLYTTPALPKPFHDGRFDLLMAAAGHSLYSVSDRRALERKLAAGEVDLVLADPTVSRDIVSYVSTSSKALVVPILIDATSSDRTAYEKEFGCILRLPSDSQKVIGSLDRAMKLRADRARAHTS
jgi:hypothetical protein